MDGWVDVKADLRIAYSNNKTYSVPEGHEKSCNRPQTDCMRSFKNVPHFQESLTLLLGHVERELHSRWTCRCRLDPSPAERTASWNSWFNQEFEMKK